jgi:uncharacterized membrane protein
MVATMSSRSLPSSPGSTRPRLQSIDIVRGAIMVLMALDHVRWYLTDFALDPVDLTRTTPMLFLTRWITHYCAPGFVFLAGTGAFLRGVATSDPAGLSRFLLSRGVWLVLIELTLVRLGWTFNLDFANYAMAGVIWMIGWCMIILAGLAWLPAAAVGALGLAVVVGHHLLPSVLPEAAFREPSWLMRVLYTGGPVKLGSDGPTLHVLYVLVPWIGVMACGYAFGAIMRMNDEHRRRACLQIGLGAMLLFTLLRAFNLYGDPVPWQPQDRGFVFSLLSFLNTDKYPASLLFVLMTIGPTIALLPLLERARGVLADVLLVFGRTPFLYYVLHIPLAHGVAVILGLTRYGAVIPFLTGNHPMDPPSPPLGYGYSLLIVYIVTACVVGLLYLPCRKMAELKARSRSPWLSFL